MHGEGGSKLQRKAGLNEEQYRKLVELSPQAIIVHIYGEIIFANPAAVHLVGMTHLGDLLGRSIFDLVDPSERNALIARSNYAMASEGNAIEMLEHSITIDGRKLTVEAMGVGINYRGRPAVQLFIRDITARKKAEETILYAEELLKGQNQILSLIAQGAALEDTLNEIVVQIESRVSKCECSIYVDTGRHQLSVGRDEAVQPVTWSKSLFSSAGKAIGTIKLHRNFTERQTAQEVELYETYGQLAELAIRQRAAIEEIAQLAYRDPLTNLPNRRVVEDTFHRLQSTSNDEQLCAIMMLDIDRFKWINDTFGHDIGDQIIKVIANRLVQCIGPDDVVSRTGGDEFTIVICNSCATDEIWHIGEQILESVRETVHVANYELNLTISIGIALYPKHGSSLGDLLKNADSAMYDAKAKGRNAISIYALQMNEKFEDRLLLETDIRRAVEKQQFMIEYQPKVEIASNRITGAEALLRWFHPSRGAVSPDDFVRVAEDMGVIESIGEWVLTGVLRDLRCGEATGKPQVPIAVNVSAQQFVKPAFSEFVQEALKRYDVRPDLLELEITETAFMTNVEIAAKNIRELSRIGVKIIFDDFGTGYSSLSLLNRFEIDSLKIDRSFVNGLSWRDATCESILISVISLAQSLGMNIIAEGVENEEQLQFLRDRDCNEAQGFLFSKSVSFEQLGELLMKDNTQDREKSTI